MHDQQQCEIGLENPHHSNKIGRCLLLTSLQMSPLFLLPVFHYDYEMFPEKMRILIKFPELFCLKINGIYQMNAL